MLFADTTKGTLYFVPVANLKRTYQVACGHCDTHWEIDTALGERLHRHLKPENPDHKEKSLPEVAQDLLQKKALADKAMGMVQNLRQRIAPESGTASLPGNAPSPPGPAALTDAEAGAALHTAAAQGDVKQVKTLLKRGVNVNSMDSSGWTPLLRAADGGHLDVVKLLVEWGADVNRPSRNGFTPVMRAFVNGHTQVVDLLRQSGAKS